MYVYIYIYICMYMYVCMCIHIYIDIATYTVLRTINTYIWTILYLVCIYYIYTHAKLAYV